MVFFYPLTMCLYFLDIIIIATTVLITAVFDFECEFLIVTFVILVSFVFMVYLYKYASDKYDKSITEMYYDVHAFFDKQYKLLEKPFVNQSNKALIKINIATAYMYNEQYNEAGNIYAQFERENLQVLSPMCRFVLFLNQNVLYIHLKDMRRAEMYLHNAEAILRTAHMPQNVMGKLRFFLSLNIVQFNFFANKNEQTAQDFLNKLKESYNKYNAQNVVIHYNMGIVYIALGDMENAEAEFDKLLNSKTKLPCAARVRAYRGTGDTSVLEP